MKKKLLSSLLVGVLCTCSLVGCSFSVGKEVPISEVLQGKEETEEVEEEQVVETPVLSQEWTAENTADKLKDILSGVSNFQQVAIMSIDAEAEMTEDELKAFEALGNKPEDGINRTSLAINYTSDVDLSSKTTKLAGTVSLSLALGDIDVPIEGYEEVKDGVTYTYNSDYDYSTGKSSWSVSKEENNSKENINTLFDAIGNNVKDVTVTATGTDAYKLTGIIAITDTDGNSVDADFIALASKDTIESFEVDYSDFESLLNSSAEGMTDMLEGFDSSSIKEFSFKTIYKNFNKVKVVIPQSVRDAVGEEGSTANEAVSTNLIGEQLYGNEYMSADDLAKEIGLQGYEYDKNAFADRVVVSFKTFIDYYSDADLYEYAKYVKYSDTYEKVALIFVLDEADSVLSDSTKSALSEVLDADTEAVNIANQLRNGTYEG